MAGELWEVTQSLPAQFPLVKGQVGWAKLGWPLKINRVIFINGRGPKVCASMCFRDLEFRSFHHPALELAAIKHRALALFCNEGCKAFFTPSAPNAQGCCCLASFSILHMNVCPHFQGCCLHESSEASRGAHHAKDSVLEI